MDARKKVFSNVAYLAFDWVIVLILSVLFSFVIWKTLLPQQYGVIVTTISFVTIVSTFSILGFNNTLSKLIPEYLQKKKFKIVNDLIRFSLKIIFISSILFSVFIFFTLDFVSNLTNLPKDALIIGAATVFFMTMVTVLGSIFMGFQNMRWFFITDVIGYSVKFILVILLILIGMKYVGALIAFLATYVVITVLRFNINWLKGEKNHIDKVVVFEYALSAFISSVALLVFINSQTIILSALQSLKEAGLYGTALTLSVPISSIPNILASGLFPVISQLSAKKRGGKQQSELINLVLRYTLFLVVPLIVILIFFSNPLILLFSRAEYLEASKLLTTIAIASLSAGIGSLFLSSLYAIKKPILSRNIIVFTSVIFLALAIIFTKLWSSSGLAYAYLLCSLLLAALTFVYLRKNISMKFPTSPILKIVVASIFLYITLFMTDFLNVQIFIKLALAAIGGIVYLLVLVPLKFYTCTDLEILKYASEKVPKLRNIFLILIRLISKHVS